MSQIPSPSVEAFAGFPAAAFDVFEALAANNTREWFLANREAYERNCRAPMAAFVEAMTFAFAAHDIPLSGSAKDSLFRINRDTRFSKDKRPYKTNIAAVMSRDGTKAGKGVFYISLGAEDGRIERSATLGAGFYMPEPADLARLRAAIVRDPEGWRATEAALAAEGLAVDREGALKRLPKSFEDQASSPAAEALKLRSWHVWRRVGPDEIGSPALIDAAVALAGAALPLLRFGWSALSRG